LCRNPVAEHAFPIQRPPGQESCRRFPRSACPGNPRVPGCKEKGGGRRAEISSVVTVNRCQPRSSCRRAILAASAGSISKGNPMKKLFVLLSLALAFWAPEAMAQARTVTGRVTAAETGAPIPGVSVSVPGTSIGTLTDAEGRFTLQVPADATTLSFRALSYGSRDVQITGTELNVTLESQAVALEGVVVT